MKRPFSRGGAGTIPTRIGWVGTTLLVGSLGIGLAKGQDLPRLPDAATPPADVPATPADVPATPTREAELEARVQQLEAMVRNLSTRMNTPGAGVTTSAGAAGNDTIQNQPGSSGGASTPPAPVSNIDMPAPNPSFPLKGTFGNGFQLSTEDDEFQLQFHDLTQVDYRGIFDTPNTPLNVSDHSTFAIPRQWFIFNGRVGKPFEFSAISAFGFNSFNLLDAYLNIHYDDRFQVKIGRYKTPFTYEFYSLPINGLVNPERSLFFNNFGLNRDVGVMAWGQLFEKRLDYAAGIFNGSRNGYLDNNSSPALSALINLRPFGGLKGSALEFLNVGGSVLAANELQLPVPDILRTNVATTGSGILGIPFLAFKDGVVESGPRTLWDAHIAWYYRSLSLIAEYSGGFQDYATAANPFNRTHLGVQGFYAQAGYFITGEQVSGRGQVRPICNFDLRPGKGGIGAIELASRYSYLDIDNQIFSRGLVDPTLWTNRAGLIDVGVNWYWSQYIKVYFGWQHAEFGSPVRVDPGRSQLNNDMLLLRFQIYF